MGIIQHKALIVISWDEDIIIDAYRRAMDLKLYPTGIRQAPINFYRSFSILPCGSNEGWADDIEHVENINKLIKWIDIQAYDDKSNSLEYAYVTFGEFTPTIKTNSLDAYNGDSPHDI